MDTDNYEGALETGQPGTAENIVKTVKQSAAPFPAYLGIAVGVMALSLALQLSGRGKWGNFISQWVPACLLIGVYNKLVKLEAQDRTDRPDNRGYSA